MVKKAHFVTGKGGVGKSLFSVVLAHYLGSKGRHTLLTELSDRSFFKDYLNLPQIAYKPKPWITQVDVSHWSSKDCLHEYITYLIKIESLAKLFLNNPISKSLAEIAPGLSELAWLGKITSSPRQHGPTVPYDELVIDSFSTGHFLSLLRAPSALTQSLTFGPMAEQCKSIDSWIRNEEFAKIHIVTLPEDLPITETIELYSQIASEFKLKPSVYLNKTLNLKESDLKNLSTVAYDSLKKKMDDETTAKEKLSDNKIIFKELPLIPSLDTMEIVSALSQRLEK